MKEEKERWIGEQCGEIEKGMTQGNNKKAYRTLNLLTKTHQKKTTAATEDKGSNILTESSEILNSWAEKFTLQLYENFTTFQYNKTPAY